MATWLRGEQTMNHGLITNRQQNFISSQECVLLLLCVYCCYCVCIAVTVCVLLLLCVYCSYCVCIAVTVCVLLSYIL